MHNNFIRFISDILRLHNFQIPVTKTLNIDVVFKSVVKSDTSLFFRREDIFHLI